MNFENLVITFLILIGILYLVYQSTETKKEKLKNIKPTNKRKKVTFDLGNNEYHSYTIPNSVSSNVSIGDMSYKVNSNSITSFPESIVSIPNTMVELPTDYAPYESNENISLSQILKNTNNNIEYQSSICNNNSRYNGDLFNYENDKSICQHIPTTNEKVDIFRENNGLYIGRTVADVYNNITKSEYKKDSKKHVDSNTFYSNGDNGRKTLKPDRWGYTNELSINGGLYKGNVFGYDPMVDKQLAF
jgi:hypothetical protein